MGRADLDMDTATPEAMNQVAAAGELMTAGWHTVGGQLDGLAGQLGNGPLGAAFMDGYRPSAAETASVVDQCCRIPGRLAETGHGCIAGYETTDTHSRDNFSSLGAYRG